eukprot:EC792812.1.p6 GENE.EC792812.1~~EC792812.1.p6  ORF type:complete len:51 (+),score=4.73 EC792812.1:180-332(+)
MLLRRYRCFLALCLWLSWDEGMVGGEACGTPPAAVDGLVVVRVVDGFIDD